MFKGKGKKGKKSKEDNLEITEVESQEVLDDSDEVSLESLSNVGSSRKSKLNEIEDFEIKNVNNKRREHLSAKEDYIQRKKEESQAIAKRKLVNGLIALALFAFLIGGVYTAFPNEVIKITHDAKDKVNVVFGGVFNKDVQETVENDIRTRLGLDPSTTLSENLKPENIKALTEGGIKFVKDIPSTITGDNAEEFQKNLRKGNYIVGKDIPEGVYYGKGTSLTIFNKSEELLQDKKGRPVELDGDFIRLSSGHLISIDTLGEFMPKEHRKANYLDFKDMQEGKDYQVGVDFKAGTYTFESKGREGIVSIISEYGEVETKQVFGNLQINLDNNTFFSFENIRDIKK